MSEIVFTRFQFLIGRLKTSNALTIASLAFWFQFLIGRLKTGAKGATPIILSGFQFLIGRLKTMCKSVLLLQLFNVSIPYR